MPPQDLRNEPRTCADCFWGLCREKSQLLYVRVYVRVQVCVCLHVHVEAKGILWVSFFRAGCLCFETKSSTGLELTK